MSESEQPEGQGREGGRQDYPIEGTGQYVSDQEHGTVDVPEIPAEDEGNENQGEGN